MKQINFTLILVLTTFFSFGQQGKDLLVSFAAGKLTSPYYLESKAGRFFSIDFDYHLSARHILSTNYNHGGHGYYDNILSTEPNYIKSDGTNADATYRTFSMLYKYKWLNAKTITANIGTGAGIMTHSRRYPFATATGYTFNESTWSDLVFPVRLEVDFKITPAFRVGIKGGFYIQPDYPTLAYHIAPKISYQLK